MTQKSQSKYQNGPENRIESKDITFVIQGPIFPDITANSIHSLRRLFKNSPIILSTWEGSDTRELDADMVLVNQDPGTTVIGYRQDDSPMCININRQLRSTLSGLRQVKTQYAVKLRSDNIINDSRFVDEFFNYPKRNAQYSIFNQRIITSTFYAKEQTKGISIPYFMSDFFHFGLTEDLLTLWDIEEFLPFLYDKEKKGQRQHWQSPNRLLHTEQIMWSKCLSKFFDVALVDEYGQSKDIEKSYRYMINNLILLDNEHSLNLSVQPRLEQPNPFPYEFISQTRWTWLYQQEFNVTSSIGYLFKLKWYLARVLKFGHKGILNSIKTATIRYKTR
ncbi:WavE lipopolysaccharide synthesis family protein [Vibrio sp. E150_011]